MNLVWKWLRTLPWEQRHLRYRNGYTGLERRGPHGGILTGTGYEHVICPHCKAVAVWPPRPLSDLAPFPPGHTFEPDERGILREVCPEAEVTS